MKLLSVIIPAYNMEAFLPQCVESIIRTTSRTLVEVVIVNDGSEDKTLRIAQQLSINIPIRFDSSTRRMETMVRP